MTGATIQPMSVGKSYDEQLEYLRARVDPASTLERQFLEYLADRRLRLPDAAQNRPEAGIYAQPDFYYERDGRKGACIFIDGSVHDTERAKLRDAAVRGQLEDAGSLVVAIRLGEFDAVIEQYRTLFGGGV